MQGEHGDVSSTLEKHGWLLKKGQVFPSWNKRYVRADPANARLVYYKDKPSTPEEHDKPRGYMNLAGATVSIESKDDKKFELVPTDSQVTHLQAEDQGNMESWIRIIELLSELGLISQSVKDRNRNLEPESVLDMSIDRMLKNLEGKKQQCGETLNQVADHKWKAKCRLVELRTGMQKKKDALKKRREDMAHQEKKLKAEILVAKKRLETLRRDCERSNTLQERIIEIVQSENPIKSRIATALKQCEQASEAWGNDDSLDFGKELAQMVKVSYATWIEGKATKESDETLATFKLYQAYYEKIHLPKEMELIGVRTQCQSTYNQMKWTGNQRELANREQAEIRWILDEMNRAINRLTSEGVGRGKEDAHTKLTRQPSDRSVARKNSDEAVPIVAHRPTWNEASQTIFRLNESRLQQARRTKELEDSLKSREILRSWYQERLEGC